MEKLSGPQLFLRYAWPCAENILLVGLIDQSDFTQLKALAKNGREPEISFLKKCFPNAVEDLENYASAIGREAWATRTVSKFWRFHHNHECCRDIGVFTVKGIRGDGKIVLVVGNESKEFIATNEYGIPLNEEDKVSTHRLIVVERLRIEH